MKNHRKYKVEINIFGQIHIATSRLNVFYACDTLEITYYCGCKSLNKIPKYFYQIAVKNQSEGLMNFSRNCYKKRYRRKMKSKF